MLLPNGWSLKPAGKQSKLGDFPVIAAVHPTAPILAVLHAGYGEHEVVTVNMNDGKIIGRVAFPETFSGLAWSSDGKTLYAGGGWDDVVYQFEHDDGLLSHRVKFTYPKPLATGAHRGVAGLALTRDGKTLWVANVFGHSVARFDTADGKPSGEWPFGGDSYPYTLALDEAQRRVYVSLWNKSAVAVLDAESGKELDRWPAGQHPNELLLAPAARRSTSPMRTSTP